MGCILVSMCSHGWAANLPLGQTQTGTISTAAQSNSYTFTASANDLVNLTIAATSGNLSPRLQLSNPGGGVLSTTYPSLPGGACSGASTLEINTFLLTQAGVYTVAVSDCSATNTGSYTIYAQLTNNPSGATNLSFGPAQTGSIGSAAESDSYTFSATVNDFVSLSASATSGSLGPKLRLYNSAGTLLTAAPGGACTGAPTAGIDTFQLPATGMYAVLVGDCSDVNAGNYQISAQLANSPPIPSLPFGETDTGTIASIAQTNRYTISANANDVVLWTIITTSGSLSPKIQLYTTGGTLLLSANNYACSGSVLESSFTFTATGTYTVILSDCATTYTGNYAINTQRLNSPPGGASLPLGQLQPGLIGSMGQSDIYYITANASDYYNFSFLTTSGSLSPRVRIYNSAGTLVKSANNYACSGSLLDIGVYQFPASGTYTMLIADCSDWHTGNYLIYAEQPNNPPSPGSILWGQVQTGKVVSLLRNSPYTFPGTSGNVISFTIVTTSGSLSPRIRLYSPDGTLFKTANNYACSGAILQMNSVTLIQTGTYTMQVGDCSELNTGNYTLSSICFGSCPLPAPVLTSISPTSATAGGSGFTLTVNGANFVTGPDSTVYWNGSSRTTAYVNSTQLTAGITALDIATGGSFPVTVANPTATIGPSNAINFAVTGTQAAQTITFGTLSNQPYGTQPFTVSATASSGLAVSFNSQTTTICTVSGGTVTLIAIGACTIQATQPGNANYLAATPVNQTFQVTQAPQTITFGTLSNRALFTAPFAVGATASSGLAVSFNSQTALVCSVSGTTVTLASVGACTIQATQAGNATYLAATPVNQTFQVTPASQTITFNSLTNQTYGTTPFAVNATASSGLGVSFNSQTTTVCTVEGATVTLVSVGACTIQATQAGNANYLAATPVNRTFQVTQAAQTISFGALANRLLGASPFTVSATASSGLAITFTSQTTTICTVEGATVTLAAAGTCTIRATQAGNTNFAAAAPVNQSFQVMVLVSQTLTVGSTSAAPGNTFSIPVTLALGSGISVDSLTFGIQITPAGSAPALTGTLSFTKSASIADTPFTSIGGTTNSISAVWASLSSPLGGVVTLGVVSGTLPAGAVSGQSYTVVVMGVSAANGGGTNPVAVGAGPNGAITVAITYLVGDIATYTADTAPGFGDATLNILDLVQELFAVNSVPGFRPAACSDRLDAMDLYPADTLTTRGGDGVLDIRDLVLELFRANNLDVARPVRASQGGCVTSSSKTSATARIAVPRRIGGDGADATLVLGTAEPVGASRERVPVYLDAKRDLTRVALTFAVGDQRSQITFVPAAATPTLANSAQLGVAAVAWLEGVSARAGGRLLLGFVEAPAGASSGLQVYGLSAVRLADNREVRLDSPDLVERNR